VSLWICRVGQNHIYTEYTRCCWHKNHQVYGHIQCVKWKYTVLANLINMILFPYLHYPSSFTDKRHSTQHHVPVYKNTLCVSLPTLCFLTYTTLLLSQMIDTARNTTRACLLKHALCFLTYSVFPYLHYPSSCTDDRHCTQHHRRQHNVPSLHLRDGQKLHLILL
jgi:hypothetical protein